MKRTCIVLAISVVCVEPGSALTADLYCVKPVPLIGAANATSTAPAEAKLLKDDPNGGPGYIKLAQGSDYPIAYDIRYYSRSDGTKRSYTVYWGFGPDRTLVGPAYLDFLLQLNDGTYPADGSGNTFLVGGRYIRNSPGIGVSGADDKKWQTRLFKTESGSIPKRLPDTMQRLLEWPRSLFWSDLLNGFLVYSTTPAGARSSSRLSLWRDGEIMPLGNRDKGLVVDLPELGVTAVLGSTLGFVDPANPVEIDDVTPLNSGDDYGGWEGLYEMDDGWLFANGFQYGNAVQVKKVDGDWQATTIVRIREESSFLEDVLRMLVGFDQDQIDRYGLTTILSAGRCRRFSKAIGRMIFCDEMEELRGKELVPIGGWTTRLTHYLGDIERLGRAIFQSASGRLHAYDGETLRAVPGGTVERGILTELPELGRTFLASPSSLYELKGDAGTLEIVKLDIPETGNLFFTRFYVAPDGAATLAFTRRGIYRVDDKKLQSLWATVPGRAIDTTGHTAPTPIAKWNGVLFTSHRNATESTEFHLLTQCNAETK